MRAVALVRWTVGAGLVGGLAVLHAQGLPAPLAAPPPAPAQPLPYSHRQHLAMGLECATCHVNPDEGPSMTFPATTTCLTCHASVPARTAALEKLAAFAASAKPIPWTRVYRLPAYVFWSHPPHVDAGIACADCHGPVRERDVMRQETNVATKPGCLTCHETRQVLTDCGDCHEPRR